MHWSYFWLLFKGLFVNPINLWLSIPSYLLGLFCEQQRAMPGEDELIFSVPRGKMEELILELGQSEKMKTGYAYSSFEMRPDFPRPEFYKELFRMWELDVEQ